MEDLKKALAQFESLPYPPNTRSLVIAGVKIALLQSDALAGVMSVINTNGQVSTRIYLSLGQCIEKLKIGMPEFQEEAKKYFQQLLKLVELAHSKCMRK